MGYRILHAIHSVNPAGGGPIEGVKQMSAVNARHGHIVELVSLDAPDARWVRECPLRCHALGPGWLHYGYSPRFVPWLQAHWRDYDVVIVNGIWQFHSYGIWRALAGTPMPYFVFTHGMLDPWFKRTYPLKHAKKWLYWPWAEYRVLRDATAVVFTCEEERRLARQSFWLYKCDEFVVNYGTAEPTGDAARQKELFLDRFPHLRSKRCLLFLGRVHVKKGPDILLAALAHILERLSEETTRNVHLVMAGPNDHTYGRKMARLVDDLGLADRVTWTGMVTGDMKWGAFRVAEAFVLPSHQENFGISVVEAMACGVPVLISNQINIWREIHQDNAGLVDTDDLNGTIRLLKSWLTTEPEDWRAMGSRAQACFEQRFTVQKMAESLVRAFRIYGMMPGQDR